MFPPRVKERAIDGKIIVAKEYKDLLLLRHSSLHRHHAIWQFFPAPAAVVLDNQHLQHSDYVSVWAW